jgi:DNA-binding transcriptional LysR family regulator
VLFHLRNDRGSLGVDMNLTDLKTFVFVAETGTISGAAKRMGIPKSTVSRRVRRLEDDLGRELLRRAPRSVTLTDHGKVLHQRSVHSIRELEAAADALVQADEAPTGTLRITTVPGFGHSQRFVRCIRDYGLKYPQTTVSLELTTRVVNLVEEGFDMGVRLHIGGLPGSPSLMSRRLLEIGRGFYASPDYITEMGIPTGWDELANHRIAAHSIVDVRASKWSFEGKPIGRREALANPRWLVNDSAALDRICLSGAGVALISTVEGESFVEQGDLVRVLPDYEQAVATATLVWPASRHLSPRVRAFIDHAVEAMGDR